MRIFILLGLDGAYDARGRFSPNPAPSGEQMLELCTLIARRVGRLLERRALEHDEPEERALALALTRSASRRGASTHAPESADPEHDGDAAWKIKARVDAFDLDATTVVRAEDRERLEHLCRYLLRPPLADRRLRLLPGDTIALELKTPWKGGTSWVSMSTDTFLERLCSLVPRTGTHQVLYRGVLAAHSQRRARVVPVPEDDAPRAKNTAFCQLMKHGLGLDVLACPCGRRMKYVATILDASSLARLLRAKGLPTRIDPIRAPAPTAPDRPRLRSLTPSAPRPATCRGTPAPRGDRIASSSSRRASAQPHLTQKALAGHALRSPARLRAPAQPADPALHPLRQVVQNG